MTSTRRAAAELMVTFGKDDLHILAALEDLHTRTGTPKSEIVRRALRAVVLDDQEAAETFRAMRHFSAAAVLAARKPPRLTA